MRAVTAMATMATKPGTVRSASQRTALDARMRELQHNAVHVASLLKTMANPARLMILCQLAERECSVGALERAVGLSQSGISQHLAVLRRSAVVKSRREGQTVYYSLASSDVVAVMGTLYAVFCDKQTRRSSSRLRARIA